MPLAVDWQSCGGVQVQTLQTLQTFVKYLGRRLLELFASLRIPSFSVINVLLKLSASKMGSPKAPRTMFVSILNSILIFMCAFSVIDSEN